jgi:decaprenylphospho-beta-D-erythro-pentofuranosid-2-ulose 2-reductase
MRDGLGNPQSLLVLGGGSEIGLATARALVAKRVRTVILASRNPAALAGDADALRRLGAVVDTAVFDAAATDQHQAVIDDLFDRHGDIDCVLVAFGVLGDPVASAFDHTQAMEILRVNADGAISVMIPVIARLRRQGHGTLVVLSSAGAERPRRTNAVYAAAKAALDSYTQAVGDALVGSGVRLVVVRPGFVHTRMTSGLAPPPLATSPDAVADAIVTGLARGAEIIWVPAAMRVVMSALRHLPRSVFRRLDL